MQEPLSFAPVSAVPVAGFVEVLPGHFFDEGGSWYYRERDDEPPEYLCPVDGHPYTGDFVRRDGCWYYQRDEDAPLEYVGPVDGRAVII